MKNKGGRGWKRIKIAEVQEKGMGIGGRNRAGKWSGKGGMLGIWSGFLCD